MMDVSAVKDNSSFSQTLPGLQLAVDSTSIGAAKECPRKYYYAIICGLQLREEQVDLLFGLLLHKAYEEYAKARHQGAEHQDAIRGVVKALMLATWSEPSGKPTFIGNSIKNRSTLLRTAIWYMDQFEHDALQTLILAGQPAIELKFSFDSSFRSRGGEMFLLCGFIDRMAEMNGENYILDVKTTKNELSPRYFAQFNPHNQFSLYSLAGKVAFGQEIKGVLVDAAQILVSGSRFHRHFVPRDYDQLREWHQDLGWILGQMESWAEAQYWPMNDTACGMYGGCRYQGICARSPNQRVNLEAQYTSRSWDPLKGRTDI